MNVGPATGVVLGGLQDGVGEAVFAVLVEGMEELGADGRGESTNFIGVELKEVIGGSHCTLGQRVGGGGRF